MSDPVRANVRVLDDGEFRIELNCKHYEADASPGSLIWHPPGTPEAVVLGKFALSFDGYWEAWLVNDSKPDQTAELGRHVKRMDAIAHLWQQRQHALELRR